jgi:ketosteroid isomerase-like protein
MVFDRARRDTSLSMLDPGAETVQRFFDAFNRLDADGACAVTSERYEGVIAPSVPIALSERRPSGHEGVRSTMQELLEGWPEFQMDFSVDPHGDVFLVRGRYHERAGHEASFISVVNLDDEGKVSSVVSHGVSD